MGTESFTRAIDAERVLAQIDREALARDCLDFVGVRSETGQEQDGAAFLAGLLRESGWDVALDEAAPGRPNVMVHLPGSGGGPSLLLNGHVDTIPIGKSWPPRRDDAWIWGRGAEDMKGGLVAMVHAVRAIERAGVRLRGDVWLTGVIGHETPAGKKEGPRRLIERLREGRPRADAILIVEGPCAIWRASLGSAVFTLTLDAARLPVHTLKVPYRDNPVRALRPLLEALDELDSRLAARPAHPLAGADQLNVGIVAAGDYPNRLPVRVQVTGTRRWGPGRTADAVRAELADLGERVARAHGLSSAVTLEAAREPFETPSGHPLVRALRDAAERVGGAPPDEIGLPLVGDANLYVNALGIPTVYYGPAYDTAHSDAERVSIDRLVHVARVYALTALSYCGPLHRHQPG
ncbi:MAG: M20/M25/M40 family metallo-hydrolase [Chloroflexi bacterium]|nr:M20/M25/M40 family metallo-hydrolase [Chloroflexota bacterium]